MTHAGAISFRVLIPMAVGSLTAFLLLTAYVLVSSAIFLVGVELDELGRKESGS